jgi:hypothetical protein
MVLPLLDTVGPEGMPIPPLPQNSGFEDVGTGYLESVPDLPTAAAGELYLRMVKIMQGYVSHIMQHQYDEAEALLFFALNDLSRAGGLTKSAKYAANTTGKEDM